MVPLSLGTMIVSVVQIHPGIRFIPVVAAARRTLWGLVAPDSYTVSRLTDAIPKGVRYR